MQTGCTRRQFLGRAAAAAGLGPFGAACGRGARGPNVVVLVLDVVRRDRTTLYGCERPTTPFLEALAAESCVFDRAWSTSAWTVPSHASLFTGLYPAAHGAHHERIQLGDGATTLAGVLSRAGYRTFGFAENAIVSARRGFAQGFDHYENITYTRAPVIEGRRSTAPDRFDWALDKAGRAPFFVFVNLNGAHDPYDSSADHFCRFLSDPAYGERYAVDLLGYLIDPAAAMPPDAMPHLVEHYDAEVRYVDDLVAAMVGNLRRRGVLDNTLLVILSDHGENFGDHGFLSHQLCLYDTLVHVPMMVRFPGAFAPGTRDARPVQLVDIMPTTLDAAGLDSPGRPMQGLSLLGDVPAARPLVAEYYLHGGFRGPDEVWTPDLFSHRRWERFQLPALQPYRRRLRALRRGDWKVIAGSDGSLELYDLAADPGETGNLAGDPAQADRLAAMAAEVHALVDRWGGGASPWAEDAAPIDEESIEALINQGYM